MDVARTGMIWAQDHRGILGGGGRMLWRVPADFAHFRATTMGCGLVMGRTTWESLGGALRGRRNVVLTRRAQWSAPGAVRASGLSEALALAGRDLEAELGPEAREGLAAALPRVWIIGGASVYAEAMRAAVGNVLVVSTIDVDASEYARRRGLADSALVHTPRIDPTIWRLDDAGSDKPGTWRSRSGDAAWRVETWLRQ